MKIWKQQLLPFEVTSLGDIIIPNTTLIPQAKILNKS